MKNLIATLIIVVISTIATIILVASKPAYDYTMKCQCTCWEEATCVFTDKTGEEYVWKFNEEDTYSGTLNDCYSVECGSYYILEMDENNDPTTFKDDIILRWRSITLVEYLSE